MFNKNVSGQFLYFPMISALSGNPVTGIASGNISGCRSFDGAAQIVCSGPVIEDGCGQYHLNMYSFDTNGNNIGFVFTASGCVPVSFSVVTVDGGASGHFYLSSGQSVNLLSGNTVGVYSGNLSGQLVTAASGVFGTAAIYSGNLNSGQTVQIYSGQSVMASLYSGELNSGQRVQIYSGQSVVGTLFSGTLNSGQIVQVASGSFGTASLNSGQSVLVYSGQLSGQIVSLASGQLSGQLVNLLSGNQVGVWSGVNVNTFSGRIYLASGQISVEMPNAYLTRDWALVSGVVSGARNVLNAERKLLNKWDVNTTASGRLTVFQEDNITPAYFQSIATASGAVPIGGLG